MVQASPFVFPKENKMKVIAVIVTYNRRNLLKRCIESLQQQTHPIHEIHVIDNASKDDTHEYITQKYPEIKLLSLNHNMGGAGGFNQGMRSAIESNADFVWLMDDDAWAESDALEKLIHGWGSIEPPPTFVSSRILTPENRGINTPHPDMRSFAYEWDRYIGNGWVPLNGCSFVSVLIPRNIIQVSGYPLAHYFIWWDDYEYTLRLRKFGQGWYISNSVVRHERQGGLPSPDLEKEPNPSRLHLYQHLYANMIETQARHPKHFNSWSSTFLSIIKTAWRLGTAGRTDRLKIQITGVSIGIVRALRFRFNPTTSFTNKHN